MIHFDTFSQVELHEWCLVIVSRAWWWIQVIADVLYNGIIVVCATNTLLQRIMLYHWLALSAQISLAISLIANDMHHIRKMRYNGFFCLWSTWIKFYRTTHDTGTNKVTIYYRQVQLETHASLWCDHYHVVNRHLLLYKTPTHCRLWCIVLRTCTIKATPPLHKDDPYHTKYYLLKQWTMFNPYEEAHNHT